MLRSLVYVVHGGDAKAAENSLGRARTTRGSQVASSVRSSIRPLTTSKLSQPKPCFLIKLINEFFLLSGPVHRSRTLCLALRRRLGEFARVKFECRLDARQDPVLADKRSGAAEAKGAITAGCVFAIPHGLPHGDKQSSAGDASAGPQMLMPGVTTEYGRPSLEANSAGGLSTLSDHLLCLRPSFAAPTCLVHTLAPWSHDKQMLQL